MSNSFEKSKILITQKLDWPLMLLQRKIYTLYIHYNITASALDIVLLCCIRWKYPGGKIEKVATSTSTSTTLLCIFKNILQSTLFYSNNNFIDFIGALSVD